MDKHITMLIRTLKASVRDQLQCPAHREIPFRSAGSNDIHFRKTVFLHDFFPDIGNILFRSHQNTVIDDL